jgi:hypothetical protein
MNKDLWPADNGPWIACHPYDPALLTLPPPKPANPFDCIPPEKLFDAGVTPECYLAWQSDRTRDILTRPLQSPASRAKAS